VEVRVLINSKFQNRKRLTGDAIKDIIVTDKQSKYKYTFALDKLSIKCELQ